ncbi:hypothetical protein [Ottowia sp. SB7-C50]|uniref:hypothetical protein n=1 Tax=Ottowia sp. SB7-C50 TaxID=3081231 RepID=UPI002954B9B1|nr:hypothetical protein [Ottowia sp. SB7-C50]WOP14578.1 hypothetical protein R0D99_12065 [Ottowia sp. SB7-C50]
MTAPTEATGVDKVFATLRAELALRGHQLLRVDRRPKVDTFVVTAWGHSREFKTLDQVAAFLEIVGGPRL